MVCPRAIPIFEDAVKSHLKRTTIAAAAVTKLLWEPKLDSTPQCLYYDNTFIVDSIIVCVLGRKKCMHSVRRLNLKTIQHIEL